MKIRSIVILLFALGTLVLAACSSQETVTTPPEPVDVTLTTTDIAYDKNRVEVVAGRPVSLTLHNVGALEHDFSIAEIPLSGEVMEDDTGDVMAGHDMSNMPEMDVHVAAPTDQSNTIEFTPTTPGEYEFFCTVAGHKEAGMVGTLVVLAP